MIVTKQGSNGLWFYKIYTGFGGKLLGVSDAIWPTKQHAKAAGRMRQAIRWLT